MNGLGKIMLSSAGSAMTWNGVPVPVMRVDELGAWKRARDGAAIVLGSSTAVGALLAAGLVDERRLMISPTILRAGLRVFPTAGRVEMQLLTYRPSVLTTQRQKSRLSGASSVIRTLSVPSPVPLSSVMRTLSDSSEGVSAAASAAGPNTRSAPTAATRAEARREVPARFMRTPRAGSGRDCRMIVSDGDRLKLFDVRRKPGQRSVGT
jgi:hypothetical protein